MGLDIWAISNCIEARDRRMPALRLVEEIGVGQLEEILDLDKHSAKGWHGLKAGTWFRTPGSEESRARLCSYSVWQRWCWYCAELCNTALAGEPHKLAPLLVHIHLGHGGFSARTCNSLTRELERLAPIFRAHLLSDYQAQALGGVLQPDAEDFLEIMEVLTVHFRLGAQHGLLFFE